MEAHPLSKKPPRYRLTKISTVPGSFRVSPWRLNERGNVLCAVWDRMPNCPREGPDRWFLWRDGQRTWLRLPKRTRVHGFTDDGTILFSRLITDSRNKIQQVAGVYRNGSIKNIPLRDEENFLWMERSGHFWTWAWRVVKGKAQGVTLSRKPYNDTHFVERQGDMGEWVAAVNQRQQILGMARFGKGYETTKAFLITEGRREYLPSLGGREMRPIALNNRGVVLGEGRDAQNHRQAFLYERGVMKVLTGPKQKAAHVCDLNDQGEVIGFMYGNGSPALTALLWCQGQVFDLNETLIERPDGWHVEFASVINERGQIIGLACSRAGNHPVLLTPVA
jgi:hypothetical protein